MKPKMKCRCAVRFSSKPMITFSASPGIANEFREYGDFLDENNGTDKTFNEYCLRVDPRYDFDEVLNFIKNYDDQFKGKISPEIEQMLDAVDLTQAGKYDRSA